MTTNNINFKFFTLLFMLITAAVSVQAQHHMRDPEDNAKKQTEWMKTELSLTNDQAVQVESINLKYAEKRKVLKEQMKALHEEQKKELEAVLTKEQIQKMETKKAEMRENHKENRGKKNCDKSGGCNKK
jgi:Spy/CpxP family protein refolding chaperone